MARRSRSLARRARRWRVGAFVVICTAVGALAASLVLPQYLSNASSTAPSTLYKTGVNLTSGSTASSADSPRGNLVGTAAPGDTLKWTISLLNSANANASVSVTDVTSDAGSYLPGSLELPPNPNPAGTLTPQHSTDGGASWKPGTPPPGATGIGFTGTLAPPGTQQLSPPFTAVQPPTLSTLGGDAFNAVLHNGLVYAVFHHWAGQVLYCARIEGGTCPGWPTDGNAQYWSSTVGTRVGTGTQFPGITAPANSTWITGDKLYWYTGLSDSSSTGLGCLDLTTTTPTSCGYLPRSGRAISNNYIGAQIGGVGMPASDGNRYSVAVNNGSADLICLKPDGSACRGYAGLLTSVDSPKIFAAVAFGDYVFANAHRVGDGPWSTYCYNITLGAPCPGWANGWVTTVGSGFGGAVFAPILSTSGAFIGVCTVPNGPSSSNLCWNLNGSFTLRAGNPYSGTGANYNPADGASGAVYARGTRVYVSNGDQVICRDFASYSGAGTVPPCAGFINVPNVRNYTVEPATELGPECLVAASDSGQITFFDGRTGARCTYSAPQNLTVAPAAYYCGSGAQSFRGWDTLALPGLTPTAYSNAFVTLRDQKGAVIAGYDNVSIAAGAGLNLSSIPTSITSITATVELVGAKDVASVATGQISISWKGEPPEFCFKTIAPPKACDAPHQDLTNSARAVVDGGTGSGGPNSNQTAPVTFVLQTPDDMCSLTVTKSSPQQQVEPGDTVHYEITLRNSGSQAFGGAVMSDDLTDVLREASFNGDHSASSGALTYTAPVLSWVGTLQPGESATITYSVTVNSPDLGDHTLVNAAVSESRGSTCTVGTADPRCTTLVRVRVIDLLWHKVDETKAKNLLTGAAWSLTPVGTAGKPIGPAIDVSDCRAESAASCTGADRDPIGGLFQLTNLGPGTYHLVETQAPVGFLIDSTPILVTISRGATTVMLPDVANKQLPVPNIPFTGGLGSDLLMSSGGGMLLLVGGLTVWHTLRRRRTTV
ncbi:DUF7927 domain-containing protein [Leifsonia sp. 2MCAF36]|uniref:DUF7927 domain-containing protein n=1 Tax=Leifsonia sp. 2MCAF36 TaxID=3232988 RepID=UPI003F9B2F7A